MVYSPKPYFIWLFNLLTTIVPDERYSRNATNFFKLFLFYIFVLFLINFCLFVCLFVLFAVFHCGGVRGYVISKEVIVDVVSMIVQ